MKFLSKIFSRKNTEEKAEKSHRKQIMTDGYPITMTPFVPETMKHAIVHKTAKPAGFPAFGVTFAPVNSISSSFDCLEMMRKQLLTTYKNFPICIKDFKMPFSSNIIAVSLAEPNFQIGESCQDFFPVNEFKVPNDAFYTYQKLSENLQATFYNENGTQFLAGLCYYPELCGRKTYLKNDDASIILVRSAAEPYPLQDREKMLNKTNSRRYGRNCEKAGKRVWVDCSRKYGVIRHVEYNHFTNKWTYTPCDECLRDSFTYKWEESTKKNTKPEVTPTYSKTLEKSSNMPAPPSEQHQQDKLPDLMASLQVLEMIGLRTPELIKLSSMSPNANVALIHKITKEKLPESNRPQLKDLTRFLKSNSDWCVDFPLLKKKADEKTVAEAERSSGTQTFLVKSRSEGSTVPVTMDSTLPDITKKSEATTSSAFFKASFSSSSTENLLGDYIVI